jgi:Flp pilus assembly protein TadG
MAPGVASVASEASGLTDDNQRTFDIDLTDSSITTVYVVSAIRASPSVDDNPTATLDGNAFDEEVLDLTATGVSLRMAVWRFDNPSTGGNREVVVDLDTNRDNAAFAIAFTDSDTGNDAESGQGSGAINNATDAQLDQTVTPSTSDGLCVSILGFRSDDHTLFTADSPGTKEGGVNSRGGSTPSNATIAVQTSAGTGGNVTLAWSNAGPDQDAVILVFNLNAAPAGTQVPQVLALGRRSATERLIRM